MSNIRRRIRIVKIILAIGLTGFLLSIPIIFSLYKYLSETKRENANLLIVEGWLPAYAIEMAYNEFKNNGYDLLVTTGLKIAGYYQISMNGYLIFYTHELLERKSNRTVHTIQIDAYSELGSENRAHFNVFINDSLVKDFYAEKKKKKFEILWKGDLSKLDSVMVQFDNDRLSKSGDRNLYVKEIIIDGTTHISYQFNSEYDIGILDRKIRINNNFNSFAELARNRLLSMGIDTSLVLAIQGTRVRINRTLTSALAFRDWLNKSEFSVKGINIVTLGTHAKRTWMTYNKVLYKKYDIGIISLPDYQTRRSRLYNVLKTLRETIGIVYYWFLLIPY